jgi:ketosteroid isomerase-like protein
MNHEETRALIECYLDAYNAFDIDAMMAVMHPDVEFKNISGGQVDATAHGVDELRQMAEASKKYFSSRRQTITAFTADGDKASIEVAFEAVPALDLPNGAKAGRTLRLNGRSEFAFRDGKISSITDIS